MAELGCQQQEADRVTAGQRMRKAVLETEFGGIWEVLGSNPGYPD
jgi:hypothetical protein